MTHPEIALETTAEERGKLLLGSIGARSAGYDSVILKPGRLISLIADLTALQGAVADAERAGRIKGLEEAAKVCDETTSSLLLSVGERTTCQALAGRIRSLIPDPETKEDDDKGGSDRG